MPRELSDLTTIAPEITAGFPARVSGVRLWESVWRSRTLLRCGRIRTTVANEDQNLRILSIFHYVVAGIAALFSLFPVMYIVIGVMMVLGKMNDGSSPAPEPFGWIFIAMGAVFMLAGMAFAACYAYAGHCLSRRRHYMYCLVMDGVGCMFVPFGTVLGVFAIIELQKEPVKRLFMPPDPATASGAAP
jgi:hypothetical protein